jgi:hypothetical protein
MRDSVSFIEESGGKPSTGDRPATIADWEQALARVLLENRVI